MADLRVNKSPDTSRQVAHVASEGARQEGQHHDQGDRNRRRQAPGAEELAVALTGDGRAAMEAHYEQDADGSPRIRIVDAESGETIALLAPEELKALTEQTGIPPGLLLRTVT